MVPAKNVWPSQRGLDRTQAWIFMPWYLLSDAPCHYQFIKLEKRKKRKYPVASQTLAGPLCCVNVSLITRTPSWGKGTVTQSPPWVTLAVALEGTLGVRVTPNLKFNMSLVWFQSICLVDRPKPRVGSRGWKERKMPYGGCSVGVSLHCAPGISNGIEPITTNVTAKLIFRRFSGTRERTPCVLNLYPVSDHMLYFFLLEIHSQKFPFYSHFEPKTLTGTKFLGP